MREQCGSCSHTHWATLRNVPAHTVQAICYVCTLKNIHSCTRTINMLQQRQTRSGENMSVEGKNSPTEFQKQWNALRGNSKVLLMRCFFSPTSKGQIPGTFLLNHLVSSCSTQKVTCQTFRAKTRLDTTTTTTTAYRM